MRVSPMGVSLLAAAAAAFGQGCKSSSNTEPGSGAAIASAEASASAAATGTARAAAVAAPRIGGSVAAVGDFSVEVLAHTNGLVEAIVLDASGKLVQSKDVELTLTTDTRAKAGQEIALGWQPLQARFTGDAGVELVPSAIQIKLSLAGKSASGQLATALLVGPDHGGTLIATANYGAELLASTNGELQAFVRNRSGVALEANAPAKFRVDVHGKAGAKQSILLAYDAPSASFKGRAAAGAELVPGPVTFAAEAGGKAELGGLEKLCLFGGVKHGGRLVAAGDYGVELVAGAGGEISAYVTDLSGRAHVTGDLDLQLAAGVDAAKSIALRWDAPSACYKGKLAARLDLAAAPVQLALKASGRLAFGALNASRLRGSARLAARADMNASMQANAALGTGASAKLAAAAPAANANANAKLGSQAKAGVNAAVKVPAPKVSVTASKTAGANTGTGAKASAKAGFSLGTK